MDRYPELFAKLSAAGQEQVLAYWNELSDAERQELASQLDAIDFVELGKLIQSYVLQRPKTEIPEDLGPAPYFPLVPRDAEQQALYDRRPGAWGRVAPGRESQLPHGRRRTGDPARVQRSEGDLSDRSGQRKEPLPVFCGIDFAHRPEVWLQADLVCDDQSAEPGGDGKLLPGE